METGTEIAKPKKKKRNLLRYAPIYVMGIPGIIYLIANNYLPMFGIVIAFKKLSLKKGIFASDWAGLDNYSQYAALQCGFYHPWNDTGSGSSHPLE